MVGRIGFRTVASSRARWDPAEPLRRYAQRAVELAGHVLDSDERGELDDPIIIEVVLHPLNEILLDLPAAECHRIGVFEGGPLPLVEEIAAPPICERCDFVDGDASLQERGGIENDTEAAAIKLRYSDRYE